MRSSWWMVMAAAFYALQYFNVKRLQTSQSVWTITTYRGLVGLALALSMAVLRVPRRPWGQQPGKLVIRGILGALSVMGTFLGLGYLPLSVASALLSTTPLWTGMLVTLRVPGCEFCCMETPPWNRRHTVGALLCFGGIVLISSSPREVEPSSSTSTHASHAWRGVLLCLASSFLNALVNITLPQLVEEDPWIITLYPMLLTVVISLPWALPLSFHGTSPWVGLTGVWSVGGQVCRTIALQHTKDMGVVMLRYLDLPFSILLDVFFFKTTLSPWTWWGIASVVVGGLSRIKCEKKLISLPLFSTPNNKHQNNENTIDVSGGSSNASLPSGPGMDPPFGAVSRGKE